MAKAAIVLLADNETPEGTGRMANALTTAREFAEFGDEVRVIFDGAGVKWVPTLLDEEHKYHGLLSSIREQVDGACAYCARAYGVKDAIDEADFPLTAEYRDHPSLRSLVVDGYEVITF